MTQINKPSTKKQVEPKKVEPKKADAKNADTKKADTKKVDAKKADTQKVEPKKAPVANPFLDSELHARMRDYTERGAALAKELRAIAESGAGKRRPDPRYAPSLDAMLGLVKKGLPLADMFARIVAGTEKGLWEPWMTVFGFEIRAVNYGPTGPRNAHLALDLRADSKANALFAKAGIQNWRSLVAADCAEVQITHIDDNTKCLACAIFHLDPLIK